MFKSLLVLNPALPLLSAIVTAILGPKVLGGKSHVPTVVAFAGSFVCSLALLLAVQNGSVRDDGTIFEIVTLWDWMSIPDAISVFGPNGPARVWPWQIDVSLRADALTAVMLCMVTFVSLLVAIYACGYMHGDRGYWRFFAYVSLFVFSMTMLVSVSNFLLLFVFWEAVGLCSYLLIGFWYEKPSAAAAGVKAFLVNRIGDFGFALAIFLIWTSYGTLNFHDTLATDETTIHGILGHGRVSGAVPYVTGTTATVICLLLMLGACGKSAQFPLHVWLPDAMEGPTPVSALIHAATMVTAGVYMVIRCTPLFLVSPDAQLVVAWIGGFTAILAGLIALTQNDLKRVLAYSTVSQLGYMFLALGTGSLAGITAGMFHLFTHAFFKALLFLGSGSVMHAMGNVIDMRRFGGLRLVMPWTHRTFLVGCLALAGIFPFAGFWSKDAILVAVHQRAFAEHGGDPSQSFHWLYGMAIATAFLTAFYTFRAFFMTFYGERRIPPETGGHAHESPPVMWIPLAILAVFAFGIGFVLETGHSFAEFLATTPSLAQESLRISAHADGFHWGIAILSTLVAVAGIGLASFLYLEHQREIEFISRLSLVRPFRALSYRKFFFDELYDWAIVKPLRLVAAVSFWIDRLLVDGLVNLCGELPVWTGALFRRVQNGLVPFYSLAMIASLVLILILCQWYWT
jgi:NADH-quinone oxidoreductase subunit L